MPPSATLRHLQSKLTWKMRPELGSRQIGDMAGPHGDGSAVGKCYSNEDTEYVKDKAEEPERNSWSRLPLEIRQIVMEYLVDHHMYRQREFTSSGWSSTFLCPKEFLVSKQFALDFRSVFGRKEIVLNSYSKFADELRALGGPLLCAVGRIKIYLRQEPSIGFHVRNFGVVRALDFFSLQPAHECAIAELAIEGAVRFKNVHSISSKNAMRISGSCVVETDVDIVVTNKVLPVGRFVSNVNHTLKGC